MTLSLRCKRIEIQSFAKQRVILQVMDRNMDYGVVYEGRETSMTTDRNSDYGDYDYMS